MLAGQRVNSRCSQEAVDQDEDDCYDQGVALPYPLPSPPPIPCSNTQRHAPKRKSDLGRMFRSERKSQQFCMPDANLSLSEAMGRPSSRCSRKSRPSTSKKSHGVGIREEGHASTKTCSVDLNSAELGIANVEECLSWMRPRKMDGGFLSTLARLGVEVDARSQEWYAGSPQEIVGSTPLEPHDTAQAASLLLRIVRSLPSRLPLRSMLEPVVQVILRSVFRDWPWMPSLADFEEDDVTAETIAGFVPFYTLVFGHQARAEAYRSEADAAIAEAEKLRAKTEVAVRQMTEDQKRAVEAQERLEVESKGKEEAEKSVVELQDGCKKLQGDLRIALGELAEMQNQLHDYKEDLREMQRDSKGKDALITDLRAQVQKLTKANSKLEEDVGKMRALVRTQKADIDLMPRMRQDLESMPSAEASHDSLFAVRVARENEDAPEDLEDACSQGMIENVKNPDDLEPADSFNDPDSIEQVAQDPFASQQVDEHD
mmetsp:Transcript_70047/g.111152  ORF Transcript_70047/g.111152 Transcript_70047/m.111152 type:complete len:486 (-) Transcript_70047:18-1475(-)